MCFERDSVPPIRPLSGASVSHDDLELTASDGNALAAFAAVPEDDPRAGIVVLPDVRGLYGYYEELALRFAERGYPAVAIDYFGRTAGVGKRGEEFEFRTHVDQSTHEGVQRDVRAGVDWLRARYATDLPIFTIGFCFGGRASWLAATADHGLAGVIGFYGMPGVRAGSPSPIDVASEMACPVLALQAGDDHAISAEDNAAFAAALTAAGVEHAIVTYPGAPHSFFDRTYEEHAEASADAWERVIAFVELHSA